MRYTEVHTMSYLLFTITSVLILTYKYMSEICTYMMAVFNQILSF